MKLQDLLKHVDVVEIKGEENVDITGIFTDSRKSIEGSVFIALTACSGRKPSIFLKMNSQIPLKRPLSEVINRVSC